MRSADMVHRMNSAPELTERWVIANGTPVFLRQGGEDLPGQAIVHVHGFAISGRYMLPTAQLLAGEFRTYVPDLPGFGRSPRPTVKATIPHLADQLAGVLDEVGVERATVVGNSLGCSVLGAFAEKHPDRLERAVMVSPAGGIHSQPLLRAISQLMVDATREPPKMATVAVPDYMSFGLIGSLKLFLAMTRFPALEALLHLNVPLLAVLGARDPLLPPAHRVRQVAEQMGSHVSVAVIKDAAHAINFSHPVELSGLIRSFMRAEPLVEMLGDDRTDPSFSEVALLRPRA
jgi:pimeloyl-ACP methyl ester carboxylesterase